MAIGEMVKMADVDVVAAYPDHSSDAYRGTHRRAGGRRRAGRRVHSRRIRTFRALSACLGSSAAGARTFTATAGQGLELMHEVLYVASAMRLPIVMTVANRALSSPLSVWGDHSDAMAVRDTGWIQIFSENGQEVIDNVICAFRIAEDQRCPAARDGPPGRLPPVTRDRADALPGPKSR